MSQGDVDLSFLPSTFLLSRTNKPAVADSPFLPSFLIPLPSDYSLIFVLLPHFPSFLSFIPLRHLPHFLNLSLFTSFTLLHFSSSSLIPFSVISLPLLSPYISHFTSFSFVSPQSLPPSLSNSLRKRQKPQRTSIFERVFLRRSLKALPTYGSSFPASSFLPLPSFFPPPLD